MLHFKGFRSSHAKSEENLDPSIPPYSAFQTTFASISLQESDCIHMLQFPQKDIDALRGVIKQSWAKGIQKERVLYSSCYEFKLRGYPWKKSGSESIPSRILMREILAYLFSVGWILHANNNDLSIFRQQETPPPECDWISITFNGMDRLRLIGASTELIVLFRDMLKCMDLLQDEHWKNKESNAWEFKIKGRWWPYSSEEGPKGNLNLLLLRVVQTLETHGWRLYTNSTLGLSTKSGVFIFSNGWFCLKDKQWAPGTPIVRG